ncbi:serine/threonine-protein kinase [Botrimarina hoheduenensis]|uniref:non-specific serine/threonine protein kinase n=1 Tax=Botrimarina hoheduenensis TaxID=2528000 RepID=A0A5C5W9W6_9BACT|nr:serine/threonine-protein kinase [Botrimarina hoheduenensis]TWT47287.1 Serine/threonine-protein kinase PknB [Botrimarina hoheduenensis]
MAEAAEAQLATLLDELTEAAESGDLSKPESLCATHPELADDIRDLWGALMVTSAVATLSATLELDNEAGIAPGPAQELTLPYRLGDYELRDEVGRGGMGIVYRASQQSLGRSTAVKLILRGALASAEDQKRFRSEAESVARLEHPGIVPIYEVGEHNGQLFFSMPFVEGETLAQRLAKGPVNDREAVRLVRDVARAIQYAHERGIIHRDLKPANILVDREGRVHVTDFGLAKRLTTDNASTAQLTNTGAILGTPSYMAPEQATGGRGEVGPLSDVYSLGALLYALVTGRPPFQGASPVDTVLMLLENDPVAPRMLNGRIDRDVEMMILRCLQKPSELRYASAGELAADLDAFLRGDPISARSGQFTQVLARVFRETHHATLLENWGLLWMWHAAVLLFICGVTNWFLVRQPEWSAMQTTTPYVLLWGGALGVWAPIFWKLRHRAGPVTAVERQIAHVWGGSVVAVMMLFWVESELGLPVLTLSPALGLICGMVFVVKAGILSGAFYVHAAAMFATAIVMAYMQRHGCEYGLTLFGLTSAATFFLPGLKYWRQSRSGRRGVGQKN